MSLLRRPVELGQYAGLAPDYDRRWARYVAQTTAATLRRLAPAPGETLLDVGCGTGVLLAAVQAIPGIHAVGADLSPEMLGVAHARVAPSRLTPSLVGAGARATIILVAADAAALPFGGAAFDAVVSNSALHFTLDPYATLAEWRRVLRPGGRLVVTDWCTDGLTGRALEIGRRVANGARGQPHRPAFGARVLTRMLAEAGFVEHRIERYWIPSRWPLMTAAARALSH